MDIQIFTDEPMIYTIVLDIVKIKYWHKKNQLF